MPKARLEIGKKETPEEIRRRLREEDELKQRSRELDKKQPNVEYFGRKVQRVPIE